MSEPSFECAVSEPPKRTCRFSLRTLLVVTLICATSCTWLAVSMRMAKGQKGPAEMNNHGVVLNAPPNTGLVEISLGADNGIRKGHKFDVMRTAEDGTTMCHVGWIKVVATTPNRSVCVIETFSGWIRKGDSVVNPPQPKGGSPLGRWFGKLYAYITEE